MISVIGSWVRTGRRAKVHNEILLLFIGGVVKTIAPKLKMFSFLIFFSSFVELSPNRYL